TVNLPYRFRRQLQLSSSKCESKIPPRSRSRSRLYLVKEPGLHERNRRPLIPGPELSEQRFNESSAGLRTERFRPHPSCGNQRSVLSALAARLPQSAPL